MHARRVGSLEDKGWVADDPHKAEAGQGHTGHGSQAQDSSLQPAGAAGASAKKVLKPTVRRRSCEAPEGSPQDHAAPHQQQQHPPKDLHACHLPSSPEEIDSFLNASVLNASNHHPKHGSGTNKPHNNHPAPNSTSPQNTSKSPPNSRKGPQQRPSTASFAPIPVQGSPHLPEKEESAGAGDLVVPVPHPLPNLTRRASLPSLPYSSAALHRPSTASAASSRINSASFDGHGAVEGVPRSVAGPAHAPSAASRHHASKIEDKLQQALAHAQAHQASKAQREHEKARSRSCEESDLVEAGAEKEEDQGGRAAAGGREATRRPSAVGSSGSSVGSSRRKSISLAQSFDAVEGKHSSAGGGRRRSIELAQSFESEVGRRPSAAPSSTTSSSAGGGRRRSIELAQSFESEVGRRPSAAPSSTTSMDVVGTRGFGGGSRQDSPFDSPFLALDGTPIGIMRPLSASTSVTNPSVARVASTDTFALSKGSLVGSDARQCGNELDWSGTDSFHSSAGSAMLDLDPHVGGGGIGSPMDRKGGAPAFTWRGAKGGGVGASRAASGGLGQAGSPAGSPCNSKAGYPKHTKIGRIQSTPDHLSGSPVASSPTRSPSAGAGGIKMGPGGKAQSHDHVPEGWNRRKVSPSLSAGKQASHQWNVQHKEVEHGPITGWGDNQASFGRRDSRENDPFLEMFGHQKLSPPPPDPATGVTESEASGAAASGGACLGGLPDADVDTDFASILKHLELPPPRQVPHRPPTAEGHTLSLGTSASPQEAASLASDAPLAHESVAKSGSRQRARRSSCFVSESFASDFVAPSRLQSAIGSLDVAPKPKAEEDVFTEMRRLKKEAEAASREEGGGSAAALDQTGDVFKRATTSGGVNRARRSSMCSSLDFVGQDCEDAARERLSNLLQIKQRMDKEAEPLEDVKQTNFGTGLLTVSAPVKQGARRRHSVYEKPTVAARPTPPQPRRVSVTHVHPPRVQVAKKPPPAVPAPKPAPEPSPIAPEATPPPEPEPEPEKKPEPEPVIVPETVEVEEEEPEEEELEIFIQRVDLDELIAFLAKQISRRFPVTSVPPLEFLQEASNKRHIDTWRKADLGMHVLKLVAQSDLSDSSKACNLYIIDKKSDDGLAGLAGDENALKRRGMALWTRLRKHVHAQAMIRNLTRKPNVPQVAKESQKPQPKWMFRQIYFQCTDSLGVRKLGDVLVL